ncbi:MAG: 23S rRNA (uridine2552-2'-O)-methyltransferase [Cellvibrionaceae bacterium]|jgi:23S rRNA (uridine2552-2'-O)-methyltransferase
MSRSKTSKSWLREHFSDSYVRKSLREGYRSRASYKLLEIDQKDHLFREGAVVVDLGAAPGGWSQVAAEKVGHRGTVVASDILDIDALSDVHFIQGDFTETSVLDQILMALDNRPVDLVISDMAPNISGMADIDQPRAMYLVELAVCFAESVLCADGTILVKVFQGEGSDTLLKSLRKKFRSVYIRKPKASRARSREVYWVAKGFRSN